MPIPAIDWVDIWFDSDGEKLHCADLCSGILHRRRRWTSVGFSQVDLIHEWPCAGAPAFANEQTNSYWGRWERQRRYARERWRREWINRFAEKQRRIRRWISFVEIVDVCARAAGPASIAEEDDLRSLTYRRLVESISRGEFEEHGKSQVLILFFRLHASNPPHRLTREYFQGMVDAYGMTDFTSDSGLVRDHLRRCWLPSDLCRAWFERHLLTWPAEFDPKDQAIGTAPESREKNPNIEVSEPVPAAPEKGHRGRKSGSGLIDDEQSLNEMLRLLVEGAPSVWAAAKPPAVGNDSTRRRLARKFGARWGCSPGSGKTWRDLYEDELKTK
jgi:hypothetical protein